MVYWIIRRRIGRNAHLRYVVKLLPKKHSYVYYFFCLIMVWSWLNVNFLGLFCHLFCYLEQLWKNWPHSHYLSIPNAPQSSLMDSNANSMLKTMEVEGVGVRSLARNTSGVEGRARALRWGLGKMTSKSITHMDLHKPNNKLVNA
jgi:hypothetical protein